MKQGTTFNDKDYLTRKCEIKYLPTVKHERLCIRIHLVDSSEILYCTQYKSYGLLFRLFVLSICRYGNVIETRNISNKQHYINISLEEKQQWE